MCMCVCWVLGGRGERCGVLNWPSPMRWEMLKLLEHVLYLEQRWAVCVVEGLEGEVCLPAPCQAVKVDVLSLCDISLG